MVTPAETVQHAPVVSRLRVLLEASIVGLGAAVASYRWFYFIANLWQCGPPRDCRTEGMMVFPFAMMAWWGMSILAATVLALLIASGSRLPAAITVAVLVGFLMPTMGFGLGVLLGPWDYAFGLYYLTGCFIVPLLAGAGAMLLFRIGQHWQRSRGMEARVQT